MHDAQKMDASPRFRMLLGMCVICIAPYLIHAQPPPPGPPPPPPAHPRRESTSEIVDRLKNIQLRLAATPPATVQERELSVFVKQYLELASVELKKQNLFRAARLADAADDCRRPIDHLSHIGAGMPEPGPPPPPDQSRQIYFRLRLSDYFLSQIPAPQPTRLLDIAHAFYQDSLQATEAGRGSAAGEYGRAADDLTHALEHLAQAYAPNPPEPPPPPPGPLERRP